MSECISCGARLPGLDNVCKEMCWVVVMARLRVEREEIWADRESAVEQLDELREALYPLAVSDTELRVDIVKRLAVERNEARAALSDERGRNELLAERNTYGEYKELLRLRAEKTSLHTACDEYEARLKVAEPEVERLREGLGQIEHIDAGGCLDGDCPHDHANECLTVLTAELRFVGETVRALLAETKEPKCNP